MCRILWIQLDAKYGLLNTVQNRAENNFTAHKKYTAILAQVLGVCRKLLIFPKLITFMGPALKQNWEACESH